MPAGAGRNNYCTWDGVGWRAPAQKATLHHCDRRGRSTRVRYWVNLLQSSALVQQIYHPPRPHAFLHVSPYPSVQFLVLRRFALPVTL